MQVASKATGQQLGVAKGATIVSVKIRGYSEDLPAYDEIRKDIGKSNRTLKSVIVQCFVEDDLHDPNDPEQLEASILYQSWFGFFWKLGVPIFMVSGNA